MKKHKSVVAILLAVMMIFTFMPAMAFAADEVSWGPDYSTVTINGTPYKTVRTFQSDGTVKAEADLTDVIGVTAPAPEYYYDLGSAEFASSDGVAIAGTYAKPSLWKAPAGFLFKAPSYVTNPTASPKYVANFTGFDWQGTFKITKEGKDYTVVTTDTTTEAQAFDVSLDVSYTTATKLNIIGAISPKAVSIKAGSDKGDPSTALFWADEVSTTVPGTLALAPKYDGADHTVVTAPVKGYSVKYTVFNKGTGAWDAVDAVTFKDVAAISARANFTDDADPKAAPVVVQFTVNVGAAAKPSFAFVKEGKDYTYTVLDNQEYDVYDFVTVEAGTTLDSDKAATKANEALLKEFFKQYYGLTATPGKVKTDELTITVGDYALAKAKLADVDAKYATMLKDFGIDSDAKLQAGFTVDETNKSVIKVLPSDGDYEVEFTSAPSKKTYHIKKASKTKKNYTFKVKAVASNGAPVTYKLINANSKIKIDKSTGKITLKKGLKKGTYNIKVKAYVPVVQDTKSASETQAIKIVIKK